MLPTVDCVTLIQEAVILTNLETTLLFSSLIAMDKIRIKVLCIYSATSMLYSVCIDLIYSVHIQNTAIPI